MLTAQWNTGYLIGIWIIVILQAICLLSGLLLSFFLRTGVPIAVGIVCILCLGLIGTFVAFPFSGVYHRYQPISGKVTNIGSRFLGDGSGGTNQNYVVTINGTDYRIDDSRASTVKKGNIITLMCTKSFQFNAASGWVCNWGKFGPNA